MPRSSPSEGGKGAAGQIPPDGEPGVIDRVLPVIYEAALNASAWPAALEAMAGLFNATAVGMSTVDKAIGRSLVNRFFGFRRQLTDGFTFSAEEDTMYQSSLRDPSDTPIVGIGEMTEDQLRASRLYRVLMAPQKLEFALGGRFENTELVYSAIGFFRLRAQGPFGEAERALLHQLLQHLRAAVRVSRRLGQAEEARRASATTMQFARHGVILLDRAGAVVFVNAEAQRIGAARDGLELRKGIFRFADVKPEATVRRFLESSDGAVPRGRKRRAEYRVRLQRPSGHLSYEILVIRLDDALPDGGIFPEGSAFLMLVSDPAEVFNVSRQTLVDYYGLSITQARLCRALLCTGSLTVAARQMDIGMNSARTHLRRAFVKLGITSQLDLLLLLGSTIRAAEHGPGSGPQADS